MSTAEKPQSHSPESPTVAVLLLNWNGEELTVPCVRSLLAGTRKPDCILVVDNGSSAGSAESITAQCPEVVLLRIAENQGFTGGNNVGLRYLLERDFDFIWVLNNDTEVQADCLASHLRFMAERPDVDCCCAKILYDEPEGLIWYAGASLSYWTLYNRHVACQLDHGQFDEPRPVPFVTGCSMFARTNVWRQVGLFDDALFAYCEDLDWSLRAGQLGKSLWYLPQAVMRHKVGGTFGKYRRPEAGSGSPLVLYLCYRNHLFIIRKHWQTVLQLLVAITATVGFAAYHAAGLTIRRRWPKLGGLVRGVTAGLFTSRHRPPAKTASTVTGVTEDE